MSPKLQVAIDKLHQRGTLGLSKASKMPCQSWSLEAFNTCAGAIDSDGNEVDACKGCYARGGNYRFPNVAAVRIFNKQDWKRDAWCDDMVQALDNDRYFRWFDSGDMYSLGLAFKILEVMQRTPWCKHWLPTREAKVVKDYKTKYGEIPSNLCIRVSATMIGDKPIKGYNNTSTVHRKGSEVFGKECLAYRTNIDSRVLTELQYTEFKKLDKPNKAKSKIDIGHCGDCRACWSKEVNNISYPLH